MLESSGEDEGGINEKFHSTLQQESGLVVKQAERLAHSPIGEAWQQQVQRPYPAAAISGLDHPLLRGSGFSLQRSRLVGY